ncbi:MAG: type IV toxin-antitoxin system AbiEi family antitoxin domain-containing protein [Actinobacteria bacterium]|nr:type IV toxin-antitoxin system AbiEi family antitoxin domain-containing protein [Actinomycetota bacterium]
MGPWERLTVLGRRQHGVVTLGQAARLGLCRRTVQRRAASGGWERLHRGVYGLPGSTPNLERAAIAAVLAAGPRSLVAARTAAALWGLIDARPWPVDLVVPADRKAPRLHGVRALRTSTLRDRDAARARGVVVTSPTRTLCDLAVRAGDADLREAVATAVQRRLTTLHAVAERRAALGARPGVARLGRVLRQLAGQGRTDSPLERTVRSRLVARGLAPAPGIHPMRDRGGRLVANLDIAYPHAKIAVEVDGFAWHRTPDDLRRDHARQNAIAALGWTVLRVSAADGEAGCDRLATQLRVLLGQGATGTGHRG